MGILVALFVVGTWIGGFDNAMDQAKIDYANKIAQQQSK